MLKDENARWPFVIFLSQVMAANSDKISGWLEELSDLDGKQFEALLLAAWHSDTREAKRYFQEKKLDAYSNHKAPTILELEVNTAGTLDILWGYFFATGKQEPIRRIVTALSLSEYSGAFQRFEDSEKTEKVEKEAYLDLTFQTALWSLESNCKQHPLVLSYCEEFLAEKSLPPDQHHWLTFVLSKVKPDNSSTGHNSS
jgi:hypothetical protein